MVVIIGAGLTGLAAAQVLGRRAVVVERETEPGGLCRSVAVDGFTFDYTGHLLHLRDARVRQRLQRLLPGQLATVIRRAAVHMCATQVPFPMQANLHGLPRDVATECLLGFIDARQQRRHRAQGSLYDWVVQAFGPGIARHFFVPYNQKLLCTDLRRMTTEWAQWAIPRPDLATVVAGALGDEPQGLGYNATFRYPRGGGIGVLPAALASRVPGIRCDCTVVGVNLRRRQVRLHDGSALHYARLVSTMPLPELLARIEDLPASLRDLTGSLRWAAVYNINLGIDRPGVMAHHWRYFPEPEFPFYRVGCYSTIQPRSAPPDASSLYVEIAHPPDRCPERGALYRQVRNGLRQAGMLRAGDRIIARCDLRLPYAYVVFDRARQRSLGRILRYLAGRGVISAGRYGAWTYASMEEALIAGREIGQRLRRQVECAT